MTDHVVRIGLIGDGPAAAAYLAASADHPDVALVSAAPATVLADPEIAGVVVATAAWDGLARAAIAHGKHVLAPLAAGTITDIDALQALASAAGVTLVAAQPWRYQPVSTSFRASLDTGELGPASFFHWVNEGPRARSPAAPMAADPVAGAVAGLDLALWFLGAGPERVYARATGGDGVSISLQLRGGANALVEHRSATPDAAYGFAWLLGPRGELRWNRSTDGMSVQGGVPVDRDPGLGRQLAEAIACWRGERDAAPALAAARWVAATATAARQSVRDGAPVTVGAAAEGQGR